MDDDGLFLVAGVDVDGLPLVTGVDDNGLLLVAVGWRASLLDPAKGRCYSNGVWKKIP